jgi:hypothetical protein
VNGDQKNESTPLNSLPSSSATAKEGSTRIYIYIIWVKMTESSYILTVRVVAYLTSSVEKSLACASLLAADHVICVVN